MSSVEFVSVSNAAEPQHLEPRFIIIGAQRCGTTSLYSYLAEHPQIIGAAQKELHFFDIHFARGVDWYWRQFPPGVRLPSTTITGEASPYYLFHPLAAQRMATVLPAVKLLVLLRNPVDRAFSHYRHEVRRGKETLSFEAALAAEENRLRGEAEKIRGDTSYRSTAHQWHSYRSRGCYMDQLADWLPFFPGERFLILISEQFYHDPSSTLQKVTDFLELPALPRRVARAYEKHNLAGPERMDATIRGELVAFYRSHNARLADFLQIDLGWDR